MAKPTLIEDNSTIKDRQKKKKKNKKLLAIVAAITGIALVSGGVFAFIASLDTHREEREEIKEVYKKVNVDLKDSDFTEENGEIQVSETKKEEGRSKSSAALKNLNSYLSKAQLSGDGTEAPSGGDITIGDITDKINRQLDIAKGYMDRSFEDEYYGEPLKQLFSDIKAGNTGGTFDYLDGITNAKAFGVLCTVVFNCASQNVDNQTFTEDLLFSGISESNAFYNILLRERYSSSISVDVLVQDTSKTYTVSGNSVQSSYMAYCGNTAFYLDASLNVLDVA